MRNRVHRRVWMAGLAAVLLAAGAGAAGAQEAEVVGVLGLNSLDGDDDFALTLTEALREAAGDQEGWTVSPRQVSLSQMSLALGCETPNDECLMRIASTLAVSSVLFGTVRRTTDGADYDFQIDAALFSAGRGTVVRSTTEVISSSDAEMGPHALGIVRRLTNAAVSPGTATGALRIRSNAPGASVLVDGAAAGHTDAVGELTLDLAAGEHRVEVSAEGYSSTSDTVTVEANTPAELEVTLEPNPTTVTTSPPEGGGGTSLSTGLGIAAVALGTVMVGATVYSWLRIDSLGEDDAYSTYRNSFEESVGDVCGEALSNGTPSMGRLDREQFAHVQDVCRELNALEVLQFVFIGTAVAAGGVGTYLLVSGGSDDAEAPAATARLELEIAPVLRGGVAGALATLRF